MNGHWHMVSWLLALDRTWRLRSVDRRKREGAFGLVDDEDSLPGHGSLPHGLRSISLALAD